jgi:hypothetical protein
MPTTREQRERYAFCGAKKKNGENCRNFAGLGTGHVGIGNCKFHLGNAPNNVKAAARVMAEREQNALRQEALQFGQLLDIEPLDALLVSLHLSASHVAYLRQEIARAEDDDKRLFRREVLLRQWNDERDRLARTAKMALDAGVDERQVQMMERYGEMLARLIQGILGELALNRRQQALVPDVVRRHLLALDGVAEERPAVVAAAS